MRKEPLITYEEVLASYSSSSHGKKALAPYNWWFPLYPSVALAGIFADLMSDGHLQEGKFRIDYTAKETEELERFNNEIRVVFGLRGTIRRNTTNAYGTMNLGVNCKPLGRTLALLGVPIGAKVFSAFRIPGWVLDNKEYFRRFMDRFFSCEGCVDVYSKCLDMNMYKHEPLLDANKVFFEDIKEGLERHFGIISTNPFVKGCSVRKDGRITRGVHLKIRRKAAIRLFAEKIGIEHKEKRKKLREIL